MLATALLGLFPLSEALLALRRRASGAASRDGGSMLLLWTTFLAAISLAVLVSFRRIAPLGLGKPLNDALVVLLMASGMALRWAAIRTLGRFFTVDVAVHPEQTVVQSGPYARMRHPSYTGLILLFLGLALHFGDALGVAILMVPSCLAIAWRIRVEERALKQALGAPYEAYCRRTRRLIPGLL